MQNDQLIYQLFREGLNEQAKKMDEFKNEVKENLNKLDDKISNLDRRFSEVEMNVKFIKSVFSNYKLWLTILIFILILVAALDPHEIVKTIKSVKEIL